VKWDRLAEALNAAMLAGKRVTLPQGTVWVPEAPFDLSAGVEGVVETEDERAQFEWDGPREMVSGRWNLSGLVSFEWLGLGPVTWSAGIEMLDLGVPRAFMCVFLEASPWQAVAALEPKDGPDLVAYFFREVLVGRYGVELFGSLPTSTENHRADLLSAEAVRTAYMEWMEWAEKNTYASWTGLRDHIIDRALEPDHLKRSMELMKNFGEIVARIREGQKEDPLTAEDKQRILDNYLSGAYTEHHR
jgi:hypothetical protein